MSFRAIRFESCFGYIAHESAIAGPKRNNGKCLFSLPAVYPDLPLRSSRVVYVPFLMTSLILSFMGFNKILSAYLRCVKIDMTRKLLRISMSYVIF